ncbi:MAG: type II secretion system minor pseudopilin GspK [Pseudomonadota bacterium]
MNEKRAKPSTGDTGAALLSVLMVVAAMSVVVLVSVEAISRATRLSQLTSQRAESFWFARSAEAAGRSYVTTLIDLTEGRLNDATPRVGEVITQPLENGALSARLDDATNCFNLNALAEPSEQGWSIDPDQLVRLSRLFRSQGFGDYESSQMAESIADWIDSDTVSRPAGGEDGYYSGLDPSYRTPGNPIESIRELRAIGPFNEERYLAVQNVLCVRPELTQTVLNLNTLRTDQAGLITSLFSAELEPEVARRLIAERPLGGWQTAQGFLDLEPVVEISNDATNVAALDVVSTHFAISGQVAISQKTTRFELLYGVDNTNSAALLWRRYGDD